MKFCHDDVIRVNSQNKKKIDPYHPYDVICDVFNFLNFKNKTNHENYIYGPICIIPVANERYWIIIILLA